MHIDIGFEYCYKNMSKFCSSYLRYLISNNIAEFLLNFIIAYNWYIRFLDIIFRFLDYI